MRRLLLVGLALSIDNLVVGFALGASESSVLLTVAALAIVSIAMTLLGLEAGSRRGTRVEQQSEEIGGGILVLVGVALMCSLF
jgi:putative Mn2+ efflux pump MntP